MTHGPLTAEGTVIGTFQYMAPEQLEGKEADARSDIFGLGCVLYEMSTGKRAFDGKTTASVVAAIMSSEPASPSTIVLSLRLPSSGRSGNVWTKIQRSAGKARETLRANCAGFRKVDPALER